MGTELKPWQGALERAGKRYPQAVAVSNLKWRQEKLHVEQIVRQSKDLQEAMPESIQAAVLQGAAMGLSFNPVARQCYLIPRKLYRGKGNEKQFIGTVAYASPSYMGLLHLATESGAITMGAAEVVFAADSFEYHGPFEKPIHKQTLLPAERTEAKAIGVYAAAKLPSGDWRAEFVDRATVQRIRGMSDNANGTMWDPAKLWTEGWKKAALRRLWKTLPKSSPRILAAEEVLSDHEGLSEDERAEKAKPTEAVRVITTEQAQEIEDLRGKARLRPEAVLKAFGIERIEDLPAERFVECKNRLLDVVAQREEGTA